ncbi:putative MFS transporter [Amycolatopsis bartoniae]|uniref:MFS transporter n=1 Tax=Amycolatopsis bartoniae TaxID=941986 RepID=A0A8H9ITD5_9PSEU|nr:MFS transporter [Amycolatopsis bartoniae]MBB2939588.1 putative MFS transporter [Amycolatopsis bartoniae]TVT07799.1 MFS transporter [Amycolatopsis bartoniae]GHF39424.1 MFS transporter [Amycolatopsis bartoniae]
MTIAARMDRLPVTRRHRVATVAIGLGLFFDLYEIFLAGVLGSVLEKHFHLGKSELALLLASAFLGMFVGAVAFGRIADRLGRRRAFLLSLGTYSLFSLLAAFSTGPVMLVVMRFLAGLGIGAEPPVSDTYLGDLLPPKHRGRYTAWAYTLAFLGVPAAGFLGRWLVPEAPLGFDGWRWMFVLGALGSLIVFALRTRLPESPRWLAAVGREREAEEIVARFERDAGELPEPVENPVVPAESGRLRELFVPPYRRRTAMMAVFHVLQTMGYYGFGTLAPIVLVAKGFPVVQSLLFTALTYLGYPIGSAVSLPLVERVERKFLVLGSAVLMAVFGIAFGLASASWLIVACGFLYTTASNLFSNAFHIYQAEIFPTALRGTATSGTYALSRLASGVLPFVLLPLLNSAGAGVLFTVVAAAMVLVVVDVGLFGPRTTGRVLEAVNSRVGATTDQEAR